MDFHKVVELIKSGETTQGVIFDFDFNKSFDAEIRIENLDYSSADESEEDEDGKKCGIEPTIRWKRERHHAAYTYKCCIFHVAVAMKNSAAVEDIIARGADGELTCSLYDSVRKIDIQRNHGETFWYEGSRSPGPMSNADVVFMNVNELSDRVGNSNYIQKLNIN